MGLWMPREIMYAPKWGLGEKIFCWGYGLFVVGTFIWCYLTQ